VNVTAAEQLVVIRINGRRVVKTKITSAPFINAPMNVLRRRKLWTTINNRLEFGTICNSQWETILGLY